MTPLWSAGVESLGFAYACLKNGLYAQRTQSSTGTLHVVFPFLGTSGYRYPEAFAHAQVGKLKRDHPGEEVLSLSRTCGFVTIRHFFAFLRRGHFSYSSAVVSAEDFALCQRIVSNTW